MCQNAPATTKIHAKPERSKFAFEMFTHTHTFTRIVNTSLRTKPQDEPLFQVCMCLSVHPEKNACEI